MSPTSSIFAAIGRQDGNADVIFVHGLTGSPYETWESPNSTEAEGPYWPKWLLVDLPHLNCYTLGFPASLFAKWAKKEMDLYESAKAILEILAGYNIGKRPLVFVCHSLGGLLVKQILRTACESTDDDWLAIARSCRGVFFLATPHSGSTLANVLSAFAAPFTSVHVDKLKRDTSALDELNESFRTFCGRQSVQVAVYYEKFKTLNLAEVVDRQSADPGIGSSMPIPVASDHLNICKPASRHDPVYLSILRRLRLSLPIVVSTAQTDVFDCDSLDQQSESDRRSLFEKMVAAGREHEYLHANDSQNRFARAFARSGLKASAAEFYSNLLADIEQRFHNLIYHRLICVDADPALVTATVQAEIIDKLSAKYADQRATAKTVMNALYFLTEKCHIRWDKP
ncbi:ABC-three component system protein [Bradyrhizobium sp. HKCCYLS20291]|uniref:ABC-three component system protein n=1 Tax=Bradyrhizobium sp. HKCCYLS20291 TaxID=3420766 RepID=UPI003EB7A94B